MSRKKAFSEAGVLARREEMISRKEARFHG